MDPDKEDVDRVAWWKQPKWLASLAALIAALSFSAFVATTVGTNHKVDKAGSVAIDNKQTLDSIERAIIGIQHNQEGIDELVAFVRDFKQRQAAAGSGSSDAVQTVIDLLCASEDPVRIEACQRLT